MFEELLENIKRADKRQLLKECVCHVYGLSDRDLLEFYGSMGSDWKAYNEPYGSDKAEVEAEITKRGLDVNEDGKKFQMVMGIGESIKEFFDRKLEGITEEALTAFVQSRFGPSKLADTLCEALNADPLTKSVETLVRNELLNDPEISRKELSQNVLDGVKDGVRDEVRKILPDVINDVLGHYFESIKEGLVEKKGEEVIEKLAALEHEQWMQWAKDILKTEDINKERTERWEKLFVPYDKLDEEMKELDREWARKALAITKE